MIDHTLLPSLSSIQTDFSRNITTIVCKSEQTIKRSEPIKVNQGNNSLQIPSESMKTRKKATTQSCQRAPLKSVQIKPLENPLKDSTQTCDQLTISKKPVSTKRHEESEKKNVTKKVKDNCLHTTYSDEKGKVTIIEGCTYGESHPRTERTILAKNGPKPETKLEKLKWLEDEFKLQDSPWLKNDSLHRKLALDLLLEYYDIFGHGDEYGKTTWVKHYIHTGDAEPIFHRSRPLKPGYKEKLREQMDEWIRQDVIEPSCSPWSFGLLPVPKKNGKTRWVVDYRDLNQVTLKDSHPLPNIEDNLSRLAHSKVLSVIDGAGAFHVCPVEEKHRQKTAFSTPFGQWQFKAMPFGLCNAPATYSRLVQKVLEGIPTSIALPYLDDTCIHSRTVSTHLDHLRTVFEAHRKAGLLLQPSKCQIFQKEVEYLGHLLTQRGIKPIPSYQILVDNWPLPSNYRELRGFLGKIAYYRKFMPKFSSISAPLYNMLSKDAGQDPSSLKLGKQELQSFEQIQKALHNAITLVYPDFESEQPFILTTEWSQELGTIHATLSQKQGRHLEERIICYGAKKINQTEKNYEDQKGENLSVNYFIKHWKYYFQHRPFILRTNRKAIDWIRNLEEPKGMLLRWRETLGNQQFQIEDRSGPISTETNNSDVKMNTINDLHAIYTPLRLLEIRQAQEKDPDLSKVRLWLSKGIKPPRREIRSESMELQEYRGLFETLYLDQQQVIRRRAQSNEFFTQDRICLPSVLQTRVTMLIHEGLGHHLSPSATIQKIRNSYYFPKMTREVENITTSCQKCHER